MEKINILTMLVAVVLLVVVVQTFQLTVISQQRASATGLITASQIGSSSASAGIDVNQMTANERMNYEMHGTIPTRFGSGTGGASNGLPDMVGGC